LPVLEIEPLGGSAHELVRIPTVLDEVDEAVGVLVEEEGAADLPHALVVEGPHAVLGPVQDVAALEPWGVQTHALHHAPLSIAQEGARPRSAGTTLAGLGHGCWPRRTPTTHSP
jgi:hypothetical protein